MSEAALSGGASLAAPWSGVTLADLFASTVGMNGDAPAVADMTRDGARSLTFAESAAVIERIVERLEEIVLEPGSPVLVAMPCVAEAPLAILAVLHGGYMPCLLPVHLPAQAMQDAVAASGARAVITLGSIGAVRPAERLRAACAFPEGPRFVFAFGERLPAGVIPLDSIQQRAHDTAVRVRPAPARFTAPPVMTLATLPGRHLWFRQDQEGLVASALSLVLKAGMTSGDRLLSTLAPSNAAALATGMVPALLTGGTLHLSGLFGAAAFVEQVAASGRPHVVGPAALEGPMAESGMLTSREVASAVFISRPPARFDGGRLSPFGPGAAPVIDGLALGEKGLLLARRPPGVGPSLALGETRVPDDPDGALVIAASAGATGEVEVAGAATGVPVGRKPRSVETEWTETEVAVSCDSDGVILSALPV